MAKKPVSDHRQRRLPRQAARFRLSLWARSTAAPVGLGLRPARRGAEGEHQAPVVARDGHRPRGRRRSRLQRDPADPHLGGQRPPQHVHRPADRVPVLPQAVPGGPPAGGVRESARALDDPDSVDINEQVPCPNCGTRGAWTEPREFNMMLKTYLGPVEDESGLHYLRPETAQGIFLNFANVLTTSPQEAAVRHRPAWARASATRSPRATSSSAPVSSSRWRWSSSSSRARTTSGTSTGSTSAPAGTSTWASTPTTSGTTSTRRRSSPTTPSAPSTSSTASTSPARSGASSRASPTAPTSTSPSTRSSPARTCPTSTRPRGSATSPT